MLKKVLHLIIGLTLGALLGWIAGSVAVLWPLNERSQYCEDLAKNQYVGSQLHKDLTKVFEDWELEEGTSPEDLALSFMIAKCFVQ